MESFCLSKVQRHSNDQVSVKAWSEEWKNAESSLDLFCKFQGEDVAMAAMAAMAQKF